METKMKGAHMGTKVTDRLSAKARKAIAKYGEALCRTAYKLHAEDGEGARTVAIYQGLETSDGRANTSAADAAIDAGRELADADEAKKADPSRCDECGGLMPASYDDYVLDTVGTFCSDECLYAYNDKRAAEAEGKVVAEPKATTYGYEDVPGYFEVTWRYADGSETSRVLKAPSLGTAEQMASNVERDKIASKALEGATRVSVGPLSAIVNATRG